MMSGRHGFAVPQPSLGQELRRFQSHRRQLHRILGDTQRALRDVAHMNLFPLESAISEAVRLSRESALCPAAIVALGTARARLVNLLLGEKVLPPNTSATSGWRWLRLQHGPRRQVRLSLGTEFEVVEPLISMDSNWDQIPPQDLKRSDTMDLSTVMDIELNNTFLEKGVQILVPPDLGELSFNDKVPYEFQESTIKDYESFYSKRKSLLENVFPIILYALNELGPVKSYKNTSKFKRKCSRASTEGDDKKTKTESMSESFMNRLRGMTIGRNDCDTKKCDSSAKFYLEGDENEVEIVVEAKEKEKYEDDKEETEERRFSLNSEYDDFVGLSEENLLDLRQIYELHPNAQILFVLFSDSVESAPVIKPQPTRLPATLKVTDFHPKHNLKYSINDLPDSLKNKTEYESFGCPSYSPSSNFLPQDDDEHDLEEEDEEAPEKSTLDALNCSSSESIAISLEDEKEILLMKQRNYLTGLVEQLDRLSYPSLQSKFTAHWVIVDDSDIKDRCAPSQPVVTYAAKIKMEAAKMADRRDAVNFDIVLKRDDFIYNLVTFGKGCLKAYMLDDCSKISEIHTALLQQFILSSFDMAREMQIVPRRIQYVAEMEQQLFDTLNEKFTRGEKSEELLSMMQKVLQDMKNNINNIDWAWSDKPCHGSDECINLTMPNSVFYRMTSEDQTQETTQKNQDNTPNTNLGDSSQNMQNSTENAAEKYILSEYCIINTPPKDSTKLEFVDSGVVNCSGDSLRMTDVTSRDDCSRSAARDSHMSFKQASLEVQRAVLARLSRNISVQLVKFVDCLRDSYFGTLQRCLESLEEGNGRRAASEAVRRILLVTGSVDLQHCASFSFLHALVDHLRRFFHKLSILPSGNKSCCVQSSRWRRQVALDTVESLSAPRLAKLISAQLRDRIRQSHDQFQSALQALGDHHTVRLQQTEELKLRVRKLHAPRFARLCLESTSLGDLARYGLPHLGKEIGRGQYGVVYAVKGPWAGHEPCAVKSVVPPDERHFNELAMEFFHTRSIPPHERIVQLRGCVVDHSYSGGTPAVLLVAERLKWDLHCALLYASLSHSQRMQVAIDIVEGIRYLHSQGLVHRDIKLKNVLLDEGHRAKLTDLGFCIPEPMMSGSIVGTPVHMAPELLTRVYDNSVDVYAFGILFWYLCAGHVRLPTAFEHFQNQEQLWSNVRQGLRPERLPQFTETCWRLMERCWAAEPSRRPLLGDVQPVLEATRDLPLKDLPKCH